MKWVGRNAGIDFYVAGATLVANCPPHGWLFYQSQKIGDQWAGALIANTAMETWLEICSKTEKLYPDKTVLMSPHPSGGVYMA